MAVKRHFVYSREVDVRKLDEAGNPIPLTRKVPNPQEGQPDIEEVVPGKFEMVKDTYQDTLDLTRVIRTHRVKKDEAVVLLDDGHEVTEKVPVLKNPNKKGPITKNDVIEEKQRVWVQSEILLKGEDLERYMEALTQIEI